MLYSAGQLAGNGPSRWQAAGGWGEGGYLPGGMEMTTFWSGNGPLLGPEMVSLNAKM